MNAKQIGYDAEMQRAAKIAAATLESDEFWKEVETLFNQHQAEKEAKEKSLVEERPHR